MCLLPTRYFLEPAYLTVNYAKAHGYDFVGIAGLSGGGWSATVAAAIDKRINVSFPIAGSTPCAQRNPVGQVPGQIWTGGDDEDFEQNCSPNPNPFPDPKKPGEHCNIVWDKYGAEKNEHWPSCPGRPAFSLCNYTCMYLLAGLEPGQCQSVPVSAGQCRSVPVSHTARKVTETKVQGFQNGAHNRDLRCVLRLGTEGAGCKTRLKSKNQNKLTFISFMLNFSGRYQVQILHEYDTCCFSAHGRHDKMLKYVGFLA